MKFSLSTAEILLALAVAFNSHMVNAGCNADKSVPMFSKALTDYPYNEKKYYSYTFSAASAPYSLQLVPPLYQ